MACKLNMVVRPSELLAHLVALEALATPWPPGFGDRLRRELCAELSRQKPELALYARCVVWLERRAMVHIERARKPAHTREGEALPLWMCPLNFNIDLDALCESAKSPGRGWVSCHALRRVLKFITQRGLIEVVSLRTGTRRGSVAQALTDFEALCSDAKVPWGRGLPTALDDPHLEKTSEESPKLQPKPSTKNREARGPEKPPRASVSQQSVGFGGLPEDAEPEDRRAAEPLSARGLSADAEFFLRETGLAEWPCDPSALARARKSAVGRLHPDRAGESSAVAFHRVLKGHSELLRILSREPFEKPAVISEAPPPCPSPAETRAPVMAQSSVKNSVCEWPLPQTTQPKLQPKTPKAPKPPKTPKAPPEA